MHTVVLSSPAGDHILAKKFWMGLPGQGSPVQLSAMPRLHVSGRPDGACGVVTQSLADNCSLALTRSERAVLMVVRLKIRYRFRASEPPCSECSEKRAME